MVCCCINLELAFGGAYDYNGSFVDGLHPAHIFYTNSSPSLHFVSDLDSDCPSLSEFLKVDTNITFRSEEHLWTHSILDEYSEDGDIRNKSIISYRPENYTQLTYFSSILKYNGSTLVLDIDFNKYSSNYEFSFPMELEEFNFKEEWSFVREYEDDPVYGDILYRRSYRGGTVNSLPYIYDESKAIKFLEYVRSYLNAKI